MKPLKMRAVVVAAAMLSSVGCTVGPDYKTPGVRLPDSYRGSNGVLAQGASTRQSPTTGPATAPTPVDLTHWWETFSDPALNTLVSDAVERNLDVQLAEARVREARANLEYNRASLFPTVDSSASFTRNRPSKNLSGLSIGTTSQTSGTGGAGTTGTGTTSTGTGAQGFTSGPSNVFQAGFDAGWEIDVFGGTRRAVEAAEGGLQAQIEARRNALVTLLAEVAQNYIELRGLQYELFIVRNNVGTQQDTLDLQQTKLKAGIATDLTVAQAEALLASTEAQVPTLQTQIRQVLQRLAVLLDRDPAEVETQLQTATTVPVGPFAIPPGLPSELLRRRPDIRQAERNLAAATANIGVATADLFPKFSLNGSAGLQSSKFKSWGNADSIFTSFGPSVSWRIFDAGQIQANIRVYNARQEQALIQYRQAVSQSFSDVENALTAYDREQVRRKALQLAVESNRRAVDLAKQLNDNGVVDFLNVLTAQQSLFVSQDQLAQSDTTVSTNLVALYKALGGGWEATEAPPPAKQ